MSFPNLQNQSDRSLKEQIFGVIHKTCTGVLAFNPSVLREPFTKKETVMYGVCMSKDCNGLVYELTEAGARLMFEMAGVPFRIVPGEYVEMSACGCCSGTNYQAHIRTMS